MVEPVQALTYPEQRYVHGDVDIAPGVAIARGVILGAEPGCRLVISSAVCLGSQVVIQASQGDLVIEPGVNLGSEVLVVGHGRIGTHACIGAASTLINPTIEAHQVVPPKSLLPGRIETTPSLNHAVDQSAAMNGAATHSPAVGVESTAADYQNNGAGHNLSTADLNGADVVHSAPSDQPDSSDHASEPAATEGAEAEATPETLASVAQVYGKDQVSQLLNTLFPHRRPLNGASDDDTT